MKTSSTEILIHASFSAGELADNLLNNKLNSRARINASFRELISEIYEKILEDYKIGERGYESEKLSRSALNEIKEKIKCNYNCDFGKFLHELFGYENGTRIYERCYLYEDKMYVIRGAPDRVYRNGNGKITAEEFKTYRRENVRYHQVLRGVFQLGIYGYLCKTENGRLVLLDVSNGRLEIFDYSYPFTSQERLLRDAIDASIKNSNK
ncbi:MAG: PD-(D/E)XK nuclease family protein [Candidatus Aenigmarchaeota archaeon]|nr:PD-(D/E)XK nuclease family protein [Candidatus Aenigmarchaeota archaeon]